MSIYSESNKRCTLRPCPAGFAVVLSLVLMSFVLLLLIALQVLVNVELRTTDQARVKELARQNAMLAFYMAQGELQRHVGPDTRGTGRAELWDDSPENSSTVSGVNHPAWTGVWSRDGGLLTWVVSGNTGGDLLAYNAVDSVLPAGQQQLLLHSPDGQPEGDVFAPLVELEAGVGRDAGAYAYWVADEGVKAKGSLTGDIPSGVPNGNALVPARYGVRQMSGLEWFPINEVTALERLAGISQLDILESIWNEGGSTVRERFHDITVHGYGVLSDSRSGGLRLDLTSALASGSAEPSGQLFGPVSQRDDYSGGTVSTSEDPGGPEWAQLRSWANGRGSAGALPVRRATVSEAGFAPVISAFEIYILPTYNPDSLEVSLHLMPAVSLWNPYNHPLEVVDYTLLGSRSLRSAAGPTAFSSNRKMLDGWFLRFLKRDGSYETGSTHHFKATGYLSNETPFVFNIPSVSLLPGEVKVFSPAGNSPYVVDPSPGENVLTSGYFPGNSLYMQAGQTSARTLYTETNGSPIPGYQFTLMRQRTMSLHLYRRTGSDLELLTDALYINGVATSTSPPVAQMAEFNPDDPLPLTNAQRNQAIGVKAARTFVDNNTPLLPQPRTKWLVHGNPRSSTAGVNPLYFGGAFTSFYSNNPSNNPSFISTMELDGSEQGIPPTGVGLSESGFIDRTVLFEVPTAPTDLFSVGDLMHASLFNWNDNPANTSEVDILRDRNDFSRFDNLMPAYAVGNSVADPAIPLGSYFLNWRDYPNTNSGEQQVFAFSGFHYDHSYLLNEALWDRYYFSSWEDEETVSTNPRMVELLNGEPVAPDFRRSARHQMIDGSFNINSTSVEAWKALLASYLGEEVHLSEGGTEGGEARVPLIRFREPAGSAFGGGDNAQSMEAYTGYRYLDVSDDQVEELAEQIVRQVKARGPFTSLADFINRPLVDSAGTAEDDRLHGLLTAALLATQINSNLQTDAHRTQVANRPGFEPTAEAGWRTENLPGWLTQADILARLGSVISTRSDTFRVRIYGESRNPLTGEVEGQAWGEAILQRLPDFVDSSANVAETPVLSADALAAGFPELVEVNERFGRRVSVVGFRWLNESDL